MDIPDHLVQQVRAGKVVLFLGAGASMGAQSPVEPKSPPSGFGLAKLLSTKFLGGKAAEKSLAAVSEYCIARTDLRTVQDYVASMFSPFMPAQFHKDIANFRWAALATTNYDQIIEKAYGLNPRRLQTPVPVLRTTDRIDEELRDPAKIQFLKLHGCVTVTNDEKLPMILTVDQYVAYKTGRERLFRRFEELAAEYTVVYVGYRVEDPNVREILKVLEAPNVSRPMHYIVTPSPDELDELVWTQKRIEALDGTFEAFMAELDQRIPSALRGLSVNPSTHPMAARFRSNVQLSEGARSFLENDAYYLHQGMAREPFNPQVFYKGVSSGWGAYLDHLDCKRNVVESLLNDVVVVDDSDRPRLMDMYVLKGYAGSGKTVALKRLALDSALSFDKSVLYMRSDARLHADPIAEIAALLGERLFVFVDGAAKRVGEIEGLVKGLRLRRSSVTLIVAERVAEWNTECLALDALVDGEFPMRALSRNEIDDLLGKLEKSSSLGVLEAMAPEERVARFMVYANRELLVALYEITSGKSFEDIILDEYRQITSNNARRIYLVVCALNRLNVPVRAGLVRRITGISFDQFQAQFFKPLEQIIFTEHYQPAADMAYRTRHPSIARIVFERALPNPLDRFNLYVELLKSIDIGYAPDRTAYRELVRSRHLGELFSDPNLVEGIFDAGFEPGSEDGYFYQQRAIFEMNRPGANLRRAQELLAKAKDLLPRDTSITHSFSVLELARAASAKNVIERKHYTDQARSYAARLIGANASSAHGYSTVVKIELDKLRAILRQSAPTDDEVVQATKAVLTPLQEGLQHFRNDAHLLQIEASFQLVLHQEDKAEAALRRANATNKSNMHVALALARLLESRGNAPGARDILKSALEILRDQPRLNSAMARLLESNFPAETLEAELYWKRSFTAGDANFSSQFWYARSLYLNGKFEEASRFFRDLKTARVSREVKREIAGWVREGGQLKVFHGTVTRLEEAHAWLLPFGKANLVYLDRTDSSEERWATLRRGDSVQFAIGFNYMGPAASIAALEMHSSELVATAPPAP